MIIIEAEAGTELYAELQAAMALNPRRIRLAIYTESDQAEGANVWPAERVTGAQIKTGEGMWSLPLAGAHS